MHFLDTKKIVENEKILTNYFLIWQLLDQKIYNLKPQDLESQLNIILTVLGLKKKINIPLQFYSSGQKKRILFIFLLLIYLPVWILDEPTNGLDIKSLKTLQKLIYLHSYYGGISIIVSHMNINFGFGHYLFLEK